MPKNDEEVPFLDAVWIATSSIFTISIMDANGLRTNQFGKIVLFLTFLSGSVFFYSYSAVFISFLTVPNPNVPFHNPEELAKTSYK